MRNTIVIVCALAILVWAGSAYASYNFVWTGTAGDGKYLTDGNWDVGFAPAQDPVDGKLQVWIENGDTVTIDAPGANAGIGWNQWLYLGTAVGDGHIVLNNGGDIVGAVKIGTGGGTGTVIQANGNWICESGAGRSTKSVEIGCSATGYGKYELQSGYLGQDGTKDKAEFGIGYFNIGPNGPGDFIQSAGTRVETRSDYRTVISGGGSGAGVYTMNGGTLRTETFYFGEWSGAISATWNINSTDVDIVLGEYQGQDRPAGLKLGYAATESAMRSYLSAVEGNPGETVTIGIVGGQFQNYMYGAAGRDADAAGLNNITLAFSKDPAHLVHNKSFVEVAGTDKGDDYHGLCNNFALEGLIVGGTAGGDDALYLSMTDDTDNMADGADNEVLYVENLTVNVDSWLLLDGHTIYYYKADIDDMSKILLSGGSLVELTPISGDANMDVVVDDSDLSLLLSNFGDPGAWGEGDFNDDGNVDDADLSLLLSNFGEDACTPASTVPEPATLTLLGLGALALIRRRRNK